MSFSPKYRFLITGIFAPQPQPTAGGVNKRADLECDATGASCGVVMQCSLDILERPPLPLSAPRPPLQARAVLDAVQSARARAPEDDCAVAVADGLENTASPLAMERARPKVQTNGQRKMCVVFQTRATCVELCKNLLPLTGASTVPAADPSLRSFSPLRARTSLPATSLAVRLQHHHAAALAPTQSADGARARHTAGSLAGHITTYGALFPARSGFTCVSGRRGAR
jgi:hypothetical protein